jgi:glutamate-1-semialdehyde aminotransferase
MVAQSGALLTLVNSLNRDNARYDDTEDKTDILQDRFRLLRKNADLELQISSMMAQFGSLFTDYEDVRTKLKELKSAVASASTIEELSGWVQL